MSVDFPLPALPYGVFVSDDGPHLCVAVCTDLIDLHSAADALATALCHALSRSWDGKLAVALGAAGAGPR